MTINLAESIDSGDVNKTSAKFYVLVWDVPDAKTAFLEVLNAVTPTFHNGIRTLLLISTGGTRWIGGGKWKVGPVEYGTEEAAAAAASQDEETAIETEFGFDFEIGGETAHITQSLETISKHAPSGQTAPDFKGAINVTKDNVEGADVPIRSMNFSLTRSYLSDQVDNAFILSIYNLCCCVSTQPFLFLGPGEALFTGASGSDKGKGLCTINYKFSGRPNATFDVGSIAGISKKGHELLWIRYADEEDTASMTLVKKPVAAYIERVLELGDLNGLPINLNVTV